MTYDQMNGLAGAFQQNYGDPNSMNSNSAGGGNPLFGLYAGMMGAGGQPP